MAVGQGILIKSRCHLDYANVSHNAVIFIRRIWLVVFFAGTLSACANVSRFEKDALVAHGEELNGANGPLYYSIFVDGSRAVDARILNVYLKLRPDAAPLMLSEMRPDIVAKYLPMFIPPPNWPEQWKKKANEEDAYSGGGFHIKFKNGSLLSVGICSHCAGGREHPVVGTPDGHSFYSLPLTEQQLIEVFGKPDRLYMVTEVKY